MNTIGSIYDISSTQKYGSTASYSSTGTNTFSDMLGVAMANNASTSIPSVANANMLGASGANNMASALMGLMMGGGFESGSGGMESVLTSILLYLLMDRDQRTENNTVYPETDGNFQSVADVAAENSAAGAAAQNAPDNTQPANSLTSGASLSGALGVATQGALAGTATGRASSGVIADTAARVSAEATQNNAATRRIAAAEPSAAPVELDEETLRRPLKGTLALGALAGRTQSSSGSKSVPLPADPAQYGPIVESAISRLGDPYSQPKAGQGDYTDCSYLTRWCYRELGMELPRTAAAQAKYCSDNGLTVQKSELVPGDLIFYSLKDNGRYKDISHVGIYAGNGMMVDASSINGEVVYRPMFQKGLVMFGRPNLAYT